MNPRYDDSTFEKSEHSYHEEDYYEEDYYNQEENEDNYERCRSDECNGCCPENESNSRSINSQSYEESDQRSENSDWNTRRIVNETKWTGGQSNNFFVSTGKTFGNGNHFASNNMNTNFTSGLTFGNSHKKHEKKVNEPVLNGTKTFSSNCDFNSFKNKNENKINDKKNSKNLMQNEEARKLCVKKDKSNDKEKYCKFSVLDDQNKDKNKNEKTIITKKNDVDLTTNQNFKFLEKNKKECKNMNKNVNNSLFFSSGFSSKDNYHEILALKDENFILKEEIKKLNERILKIENARNNKKNQFENLGNIKNKNNLPFSKPNESFFNNFNTARNQIKNNFLHNNSFFNNIPQKSKTSKNRSNTLFTFNSFNKNQKQNSFFRSPFFFAKKPDNQDSPFTTWSFFDPKPLGNQPTFIGNGNVFLPKDLRYQFQGKNKALYNQNTFKSSFNFSNQKCLQKKQENNHLNNNPVFNQNCKAPEMFIPAKENNKLFNYLSKSILTLVKNQDTILNRLSKIEETNTVCFKEMLKNTLKFREYIERQDLKNKKSEGLLFNCAKKGENYVCKPSNLFKSNDLGLSKVNDNQTTSKFKFDFTKISEDEKKSLKKSENKMNLDFSKNELFKTKKENFVLDSSNKKTSSIFDSQPDVKGKSEALQITKQNTCSSECSKPNDISEKKLKILMKTNKLFEKNKTPEIKPKGLLTKSTTVKDNKNTSKSSFFNLPTISQKKDLKHLNGSKTIFLNEKILPTKTKKCSEKKNIRNPKELFGSNLEKLNNHTSLITPPSLFEKFKKEPSSGIFSKPMFPSKKEEKSCSFFNCNQPQKVSGFSFKKENQKQKDIKKKETEKQDKNKDKKTQNKQNLIFKSHTSSSFFSSIPVYSKNNSIGDNSKTSGSFRMGKHFKNTINEKEFLKMPFTGEKNKTNQNKINKMSDKISKDLLSKEKKIDDYFAKKKPEVVKTVTVPSVIPHVTEIKKEFGNFVNYEHISVKQGPISYFNDVSKNNQKNLNSKSSARFLNSSPFPQNNDLPPYPMKFKTKSEFKEKNSDVKIPFCEFSKEKISQPFLTGKLFGTGNNLGDSKANLPLLYPQGSSLKSSNLIYGNLVFFYSTI